MTDDILAHMVKETRERVAQRKRRVPLEGIRALASMQRRPHDLASALRAQSSVSLIVQIKRTDPTMAQPIEQFDPFILAQRFEHSGAAALCVVTNQQFYNGDIVDLVQVAQECHHPGYSSGCGRGGISDCGGPRRRG
ncbi:MAG: hypothetical protein HC915_04785 [Anaerolineae bacterium]|nr:hypothetical protein [Anaerolineae bacterium]